MEEVKELLTSMHTAIREYHDKVVLLVSGVSADLDGIKSGITDLNQQILDLKKGADLDDEDKAALDDIAASATALKLKADGIANPVVPLPPVIPAS